MYRPTDEEVTDLVALLDDYYPDGADVDVFEDNLARRLGLYRHPSMDLEQWRRLRVRVIDAADDTPIG